MKQFMIAIVTASCFLLNPLSSLASQQSISPGSFSTSGRQADAKGQALNKHKTKKELRQLKKQARRQNPEVAAKTAKNLGIASMVCIITGLLLPVGIIFMIIALKKAKNAEEMIVSDSSDQHREAYADAKVGQHFAYFSLGYLGLAAAFIAAVLVF